jgi:hypothetical protein
MERLPDWCVWVCVSPGLFATLASTGHAKPPTVSPPLGFVAEIAPAASPSPAEPPPPPPLPDSPTPPPAAPMLTPVVDAGLGTPPVAGTGLSPAPVVIDAVPCPPPKTSYWHSTLKPKFQYKSWGYPEYFCEPPLGASVNAALQRQKTEGVRQSLFLYQFDFAPPQSEHPERLNATGEYRLRKLAERSLRSGLPLMVEWSLENPQLSEQRRQAVVNYCTENGLGLDDSWVRLAPNEHRLRGPEAKLLYESMLRQTTTDGTYSGPSRDQGSQSPSSGGLTSPSGGQ